MKNKTLLQLGLCALLAGAVTAMPVTAMAARNYDRSARHQVQKHHHGDRYGKHYSRSHRQHASKHGYYQNRSHRHNYYQPRHYRSHRVYSYPHFHYQPGITIWFRLN